VSGGGLFTFQIVPALMTCHRPTNSTHNNNPSHFPFHREHQQPLPATMAVINKLAVTANLAEDKLAVQVCLYIKVSMTRRGLGVRR
jgi:hypothetical protein